MVPSEGVRAGVLVADVTEGGGVGLFRRPVVRERKAVKRAWVEERRSGVRGTWSAGGDMRLGVAWEVRVWCGADMGEVRLGDQRRESYEGGAGASSLPSGLLDGLLEGLLDGLLDGLLEAAGLAVPICCRGRVRGEAARQRLTAGESTGWRFGGREEGEAASRHMMDGI